MAAIGFQYPHDAFRETHELMDSLIASYQAGCKEDTDAVREAARMVEDAVAAAAAREGAAAAAVRALTTSLSQLEVAADYTEAQAAHAAEVAALNAAIAADRGALTRIAEDTKGTADQRRAAQQQRQQLVAAKAEVQQRGAEEEPRKVHQISLYAHITGLAFALDTLTQPVQRATLSDPSGVHEVRTITIDAAKRGAFETAAEVWGML